MISLLKLKYFCSVVENQSFTKAGQINHVSQTSITQQIHEIETELDRKLINRSTKPISLTATGKVFYVEAKKVLHQYQIFQKNIFDYIEAHEKKTIIGYTTPLDLKLLNEVINLANESHITVLKQKMSEISANLKSQKIDLAITFASEVTDDQNLDSVSLTKGKFVACVGKQHPLAKKDCVTMADVYQNPLIMLDPQIVGKSFDLMANKTKQLGLNLNIVDTTSDVESELFLLEHNQYVGFLPDKYPIDETKVKKITVVDSPHDYEIILAKNKDNHDLDTNEFFDYVLNHFHRFS